MFRLCVQVVAVADIGGIRVDPDFDVEVPGRATGGAGLALAGELDAGAGGNTGGDLHRQGPAAADPALAGALVARVLDDRAEALAGAAGRRRHDLAEDGADSPLDLAAAAADVTPFRMAPGTAAGAVAGGAGDGGVDFNLLVYAENGIAEVDPHADQGILAAAYPRRRTGLSAAGAEEGLEDVLEREALTGVAAATEAVVGAVLISGGVVDPALLRIGEDLVGVGYGLEPVRCVRSRVDIRVQGPRQFAVRLLDLFARRFAGDSKNVIVAAQNSFLFLLVLPLLPCRPGAGPGGQEVRDADPGSAGW